MPAKSGVSRTRNIDYDDDELYDDNDYYEETEEGGEGTSEDDKEQMRVGTIRVREALADLSSFVSDEQIHESLWHYYYDVAKSVNYLKNRLGAGASASTESKYQPPKKEKAISRFDRAVSVADQNVPTTTGKQTHAQFSCLSESFQPVIDDSLPLPPRTMPANTVATDDFFWDVPWGQVPSHRLGVITVEAPAYKGGLRGGSSKLAALAAKRRKEREAAEVTASTANTESDAALAMLDRLTVKSDSDATPSTNDGASESKRPLRISRYPIRRRSPPPQPEASKEEESVSCIPQQAITVESPAQRASASIFATTLCGPSQTTIRTEPQQQDFQAPYASSAHMIAQSPLQVQVRMTSSGRHRQRVRVAGAIDFFNQLFGRISLNNTGTTPKKKKRPEKSDMLSESIEKLIVDEPKVKSKNLDVGAEFAKSNAKRMANFVVVGHVDHGKSTLMGRLLYDLKVIDQRSIDKLRKEAETIGKSSFALAWVMDETSEERSRGVTVDIATNYFETEKSCFTILDAPGHKDFIPSMISGASQADFPVLVIDASTNSFESGLKGQTKEHILIARSMGMQHIIVAVNKMDTVTWSKPRFDDIVKRMTSFLTDANFSEKRITFIPLAGLTGENVTKKTENSAAHWYTGETLLEALERVGLPERSLTKPLRLSVADVFRGDMRSPLSISGRIDCGTLQVGDVILALPANQTATIKAIEVRDAPVEWAVAGQITTLHLTDMDPVHLRQGDIVCAPSAPVKLVKAFTSKLLAFEHILPTPVEVFRGTLHSPGGVRTLSARLNKFTGEVVKRKPRIVKPGEVARVVIELERELPIEEGMRVVVRERGRTVGAGLMENVA